jgi:hypothetical protein
VTNAALLQCRTFELIFIHPVEGGGFRYYSTTAEPRICSRILLYQVLPLCSLLITAEDMNPAKLKPTPTVNRCGIKTGGVVLHWLDMLTWLGAARFVSPVFYLIARITAESTTRTVTIQSRHASKLDVTTTTGALVDSEMGRREQESEKRRRLVAVGLQRARRGGTGGGWPAHGALPGWLSGLPCPPASPYHTRNLQHA